MPILAPIPVAAEKRSRFGVKSQRIEGLEAEQEVKMKHIRPRVDRRSARNPSRDGNCIALEKVDGPQTLCEVNDSLSEYVQSVKGSRLLSTLRVRRFNRTYQTMNLRIHAWKSMWV